MSILVVRTYSGPKLRSIAPLGLVLSLVAATVATPSEDSRGLADQKWAELERLNPTLSTTAAQRPKEVRAAGRGSIIDREWRESIALRYRELGMEFWQQFPHDLRRYRWLSATVYSHVTYKESATRGENSTVSAPGDDGQVKKARWETNYRRFLAELAADSRVEPSLVAEIRLRKCASVIETECPSMDRESIQGVVTEVLKLSLLPADEIDESTIIYRLAAPLLVALERFPGLDEVFLYEIGKAGRPKLDEFSNARLSIQQWRKTPAERIVPFVLSDDLRLSEYRGKVVLVDVWSNNCPSCIEMIGPLKALYERHRHKGFEIVGVWLAGSGTGKSVEQQKAVALGHLANGHASWRQIWLDERQSMEFWKRHALTGVPVTWVFDRRGLLVAANAYGTQLEDHIQRAIDTQ